MKKKTAEKKNPVGKTATKTTVSKKASAGGKRNRVAINYAEMHRQGNPESSDDGEEKKEVACIRVIISGNANSELQCLMFCTRIRCI